MSARVDMLRSGSVLLRGAPTLAGWLAGWAATEFTPHAVAGHALSTVGMPHFERLTNSWGAQRAGHVLTDALGAAFGDNFGELAQHPFDASHLRHSVAGIWHATKHRKRFGASTTEISYGPHQRDHLLDIWRSPDLPADAAAPVLLQIPGGAGAISEKRGQAYPLMARMVQHGWICVSINYSRSPFSAWPAHITDVKRAIAWVRDNIAGHGGDPNFIAITGGSAGGHLASLAALTADDPTLQPGFEHVDTSVQAAVPYYGAYDLTDASNMCALMMPFLEQFVMRARIGDRPELFRDASPMHRVHRDAPPFFVLHGSNDAVIPAGQASAFVSALRGAGAQTVVHADLPNAHHAFDALATLRSQLTAEAVANFLGISYARHRAGLQQPPLAATAG